jgi:hypothetical protein
LEERETWHGCESPFSRIIASWVYLSR